MSALPWNSRFRVSGIITHVLPFQLHGTQRSGTHMASCGGVRCRRLHSACGGVLPLRMRCGPTAPALRVLPPKARGAGEFRIAHNAQGAVDRCWLVPARLLRAASPRCITCIIPTRLTTAARPRIFRASMPRTHVHRSTTTIHRSSHSRPKSPETATPGPILLRYQVTVAAQQRVHARQRLGAQRIAIAETPRCRMQTGGRGAAFTFARRRPGGLQPWRWPCA
jgi:hypothetical protein